MRMRGSLGTTDLKSGVVIAQRFTTACSSAYMDPTKSDDVMNRSFLKLCICNGIMNHSKLFSVDVYTIPSESQSLFSEAGLLKVGIARILRGRNQQRIMDSYLETVTTLTSLLAKQAEVTNLKNGEFI